jgi:hypothetical protein
MIQRGDGPCMTLAMREKFRLVVLAEKGEDRGGPVGD